MQDPIIVTSGELKQMFANLVVDVFKNPEKYQRGTGIHEFYNDVKRKRAEETKRRNSLDLLDNTITFAGVSKDGPSRLGERWDEEEDEELTLKRKCYVVMKCVNEHYFTLEEALKTYEVSSTDYEKFLQNYKVE